MFVCVRVKLLNEQLEITFKDILFKIFLGKLFIFDILILSCDWFIEVQIIYNISKNALVVFGTPYVFHL